MGSNHLLPLALLPAGEQALVKEIAGGCTLQQRLAAMGLVRGLTVRVVQNDFSGPLVVALGEGRLAIGRGMGQKILVEGGS